MIPFILGALAAVGLSELSKRGKMMKGGIMGDIYSLENPEQFKQLITIYNDLSDYTNLVNGYYIDHHDNSIVFLTTPNISDIGKDKIYNYVNSLKDKGFSIINWNKTIDSSKYEYGLDWGTEKGSMVKQEGKDEKANPKWFKLYLINRIKYAKGGGVGYTEQFEEVADFGNEQYYIRKWGKVSTDKKDNVELLAVANIKDLEDYMSEEELPKEGNFQLDITLVPIEKHISKKHKSSANDDSVSMGGNTIVNIVSYMGGLNYEPQEKVFFKTFDEAHKYLMSKQLNDKISSQGMMSGFILDKAYNRIGQTNWDYLSYMMGETERFAKGGGVGISHYKVGDEVFIDYMDAVNYCDKHNLPYEKIVKTKNK